MSPKLRFVKKKKITKYRISDYPRQIENRFIQINLEILDLVVITERTRHTSFYIVNKTYIKIKIIFLNTCILIIHSDFYYLDNCAKLR